MSGCRFVLVPKYLTQVPKCLEFVLEVVPTLDPIDPVDVTGISVAQTQNSVDTDNVDTSNDEGVRQDRHKVVTLEDTEHFIKDNRNKMKCYN